MVGILLVLIYLLLTLLFHSKQISSLIAVSHRGAAGLAPENTLAGIEIARNYDATHIEFDIQRSSDGVLVLMHDRDVSRTTDGQGLVKEVTWSNLERLDAGKYFSPTFAGEKVPTLRRVLDSAKADKSSLVIELKNPELYPNIEQELASAILEYRLQDRVIVVSFEHEALEKIIKILPNIKVGLLSVYPVGITHIQENQIVAVHWISTILDPTLVYRLHKANQTVWVWTVNNPFLMQVMCLLGVDGITTDRLDVWNNQHGYCKERRTDKAVLP